MGGVKQNTKHIGNTESTKYIRPTRKTISPKNLLMIGIPRHLTDKSIHDFDTFGDSQYENVKEVFISYINNIHDNFYNCRGIYMYGSNGSGKSMCASMIIKEAYKHRYTAYRVTFAEYLNIYTRAWSAKSLNEKDELEIDLYKYKASEFLALEEIGKEIENSVTIPILEDLLRYREDKELPTIICTNLRMTKLREQYGESIFSLLQGNNMPVKIEGEDQRLNYFNKRCQYNKDVGE